MSSPKLGLLGGPESGLLVPGIYSRPSLGLPRFGAGGEKVCQQFPAPPAEGGMLQLAVEFHSCFISKELTTLCEVRLPGQLPWAKSCFCKEAVIC